MMDEDEERNVLRQLLEGRCPDVLFRPNDIDKLADAGYSTSTTLAATIKEDLVAVLPGRSDSMDWRLRLKSIVKDHALREKIRLKLLQATVEFRDELFANNDDSVRAFLFALLEPVVGMFPSQGFPVMMLIFGAVIMVG